MLKVKRPAVRKDEMQKEESERALTVKELNYVLSCVSKEPLKWQAFIELSADSWARRGEVCGLQWQDIDWKSGTITIRRNLQYTVQKGVYIAAPKNGKARTIDIGAKTISLLKRLREEADTNCISMWVFTQDGTTEPMFPQTPTRYFKRVGERYGIRDFHPHLLRHTGITIALLQGQDPASVAARAGHSDTAVMFRNYAHPNEESIRNAGQAVRDALKTQSA